MFTPIETTDRPATDLITRRPLPRDSRHLDSPPPRPLGSAAPAEAMMSLWLAAMLDEVDYPMLLVGAGLQVLHANRAAVNELDGAHPLQCDGRELRARLPKDQVALREAVEAAQQRGWRRLLTFGEVPPATSAAVVPMACPAGSGVRPVLLVLGKSAVCARLSVEWYAREHKLTPAEGRVLSGLCNGQRPQELAQQHGVAIATVRTQIASIRGKTGANSLRELLQKAAVLPPMVSALRNPERTPASPD